VKRPPRAHREIVYASSSVLLRYPEQRLVDDLPILRSALSALPGRLSAPLWELATHMAATGLLDLQAAYVSTFDMQRKCCLYLSYYLNGDTRRRGEALLRFKQAYKQAGLQLTASELPDFLPALLELAASGGEPQTVELLQMHRVGVQVLHKTLAEMASPYALALEAVERALPGPPKDLFEQADRLARTGPPFELVGLPT